MTCVSPESGLVPFLAAGTLDPPDRDAAAAHSTACPDCAEELRAARALACGLRTLHLTGEEVAEAAAEGTRPVHLEECPACAADFALLARVNAELAGAPRAIVAGGSGIRGLANVLASARVTFPAIAALLLVSLTMGIRLDRAADENARLSAGSASAEHARRERDEARRERAELRSALDRLSQPQVNAPVVNLEPAGATRGEAGVAAPEVPAGAAFVTLVLHLVEERPAGAYAVEIADAEGATVWKGGGLVMSAFGTLSLGVPTTLLPRGEYRVRVTADRGRTRPIETYAFRVR